MLFAVLLHDDPERLHLRQGHRDEHLAYVAAQGGRIIAVGALRSQPEDAPQGPCGSCMPTRRKRHGTSWKAIRSLSWGCAGPLRFPIGENGFWSEPFAKCMSAVEGETAT